MTEKPSPQKVLLDSAKARPKPHQDLHYLLEQQKMIGSVPGVGKADVHLRMWVERYREGPPSYERSY